MPVPTFDESSIQRLSDRIGYEDWLLENIFSITENNLFPSFPDGVVYPLGSAQAQYEIHGAPFTGYVGSWQGGFLNEGAPYTFVSAFKVLDMLIEWVAEENGRNPGYRFKEKIRNIGDPSIVFPNLINSRFWLKDRLLGFYKTLEPLRGTIIHDKSFSTTNGAIRVLKTTRNNLTADVNISADKLKTLAHIIISVLRYVDHSWQLDDFREKILRYNLDLVASLHGLSLMGQKHPCHARVRVYTSDPDPLHTDPGKIYSNLISRDQNDEISFDLRVLIVEGGVVIDAYLFPWSTIAASGISWQSCIDSETYRSAIPVDIQPEHLLSVATSLGEES